MRFLSGKTSGLAVVSLALALGATGRARAQDDGSVPREVAENRVSVTVHGSARQLADSVDIEFVVEATDEDATAAEKKHRDKLSKLLKALRGLKSSIEEKVQAAAQAASPKDDVHHADADTKHEGDTPKTAPPPPPAEKPVKKKKPAADEDEDDDSPRTKKKGGESLDDEPAPKAKKKRKKAADSDSDEDDDAGIEPPSFSIELREGRSMLGVARGGDPQGGQTSQVTVATAVIVRLDGIAQVARPRLRRRLAQILDKAIEAGADGGGANSGEGIGRGVRPAFRFHLKDNEAIREAAYREAMKAGRRRAASLAKLAGRELGLLANVQEVAWNLRAGADDNGVGFDVMVGRVGNNKPNNHDLLTSTTEIELEVALAVEYDLGKPLPAEPAK